MAEMHVWILSPMLLSTEVAFLYENMDVLCLMQNVTVSHPGTDGKVVTTTLSFV